MIPIPMLATKAAQLFAPLAAKFASPLVKWGTIGGIAVALFLWSHVVHHNKMRAQFELEQQAALAAQAAHVAKDAVAVQVFNAHVAEYVQTKNKELVQRIEPFKRKAIRDAQQNPPILLSRDTVQFYADLLRVPNQAGVPAASADDRPTGGALSRGGVAAPALAVVQVEDQDGTPVDLTADELKIVVTNVVEKYSLMKGKYKGLDDFNTERERRDLERLQHDVQHDEQMQLYASQFGEAP